MRRAAKVVSRREFLLLAAAGAGGSLYACAQRAAPVPASPTAAISSSKAEATPTPAAPVETGRVALKGGSADLWTWNAQVSGQVESLSCEKVQIKVNQQMMDAEIKGNQFQASVPLQPGENIVTAACLPGGQAAPPLTFTARLRNSPQPNIQLRFADGRVLLSGASSQPAPVQPSPIASYRWSGEGLIEDEREGVETEIQQPPADGMYALRLLVIDQDGRSDSSAAYFRMTGGQPQLIDWAAHRAEWIDQAVVYGVIPRKFGPDGFRSIAARLGVMQELGVTALWLAPINSSPEGDYGYAITDYFELRQQYGTKDEFRGFVQAAHQHGIRVLMDFVPNHSSQQHPYFVDAQEKGAESHYWTFYDRDENGQPTHYFNWTHLPNLNYSNPEVENWMTEAFAYWVREFDVDGFRVDAAWGIRQRKPDYWPRWRAALKRIKPDLLLLAEASARDDYYFTQGFDAAYDWTDQLGKWAWERVFEDDKLLLYNLNIALTNNRNGYHPEALIFRFLNNNDTGARFLTRYGLEMARVATVLLLTLPGIPCIYTGDEIGAEFTPYDDPQPLDWTQDPHGMFAFYQNLVRIRRETPALHARGWQIVDAEPHQKVLAYLRFTTIDSAPALVLLNFSGEPAEVQVDLPQPFAASLQGAPLVDLLSGETLPGGGNTASLPPLSARILTKQQD